MLLNKLMFIKNESLSGDSGYTRCIENVIKTIFFREDVYLYIQSDTDLKGDGSLVFKLCGVESPDKKNDNCTFVTTSKFTEKDLKFPTCVQLNHSGDPTKSFKYFCVKYEKTGSIDGNFTLGLSIGASSSIT